MSTCCLFFFEKRMGTSTVLLQFLFISAGIIIGTKLTFSQPFCKCTSSCHCEYIWHVSSYIYIPLPKIQHTYKKYPSVRIWGTCESKWIRPILAVQRPMNHTGTWRKSSKGRNNVIFCNVLLFSREGTFTSSLNWEYPSHNLSIFNLWLPQ